MLWFEPESAVDERVEASVRRLLAPDYEPHLVLKDGSESDWPADRPGRLLLSLSHLSRLTRRVDARLEELVHLLPTYLNAEGYFGRIIDGFDEQQLAGHAWLVSGLLAYAEVSGDEDARARARRIVESLYLPLTGTLVDYPRGEARGTEGAASGSLVSADGRWSLSSDTYCVLICLEALVGAFEQWSIPSLGNLIHEFFDLIDRDDLVANGAQLHATMAAARCAAIFSRLSGDDRGLRVSRSLFDAYRRWGRTLNSATMNWFGRPDSWTEPCAMVDVQLAARELWRATGDRAYLDEAISVEENALGYAQKPGGGFGLDHVATPDRQILSNDVLDAAWCCSMRGALGLVDGRLGATALREGDGSTPPMLVIESVHSGRLLDEHGQPLLEVETDYPRSAAVTFIAGDAHAELQVLVQLPSWAGATARHREPTIDVWLGAQHRRVTIDVPLPQRVEHEQTTEGADLVLHYRGPALLAVPLGQPFHWSTALPVSDILFRSPEEAATAELQIAFDHAASA